jgi:PGF-CTERM protein
MEWDALRWSIRSGGGSDSYQIGIYNASADETVINGEWHHLVITKKQGLTSSTMDMYLDGEKLPTIHFDGGSIRDDPIGRDMYFMAAHVGSTDYGNIDGQFDELRIYNRHLNVNEVKALYERRKYASPKPTLTLSLEIPTTKPTPAPPSVYYEEDFETDSGYTSLTPEYAYWDSEQGNYYVKTYDNLAHKYWAYSPKFQTVDINHDIIVELDMKCENLDWGTYPGVAFYYDNPDTIEGYVFRVEFHWDDHYGKNLVIADSYKHTHWANAPPRSNVWYHVKLKYHASTQKLDIYITEKSTGESFFIKENADFRLGMGYYDEPDYGNEWSPIRVDNIRIAAIGKPPALTPTPTSTPPAPSPTPVSQEHIKFIVTPLGDGKYNITYTEYAPFTVKILRYSDGKGIACVPLYQLEPKEIIEASKEYLQQNAPNIIGTQLTERAVTKILEEAGVYVFSGPFGIIIKVFSNLATAVDYLSYLTTPYIDLGAITDNEGKATLYLPNRAYTTTMDMSAFITQTQEPIDQTAPATQEQIAEQIASILLPTIQEELQPIAYKDITLAIPTKITIDDKGVVTTETTEELKTYTKFRAINSKTVGNSRELIFWVEPKKIPPTTVGTGKEEEKAMKAHVLSPERHFFPHVVSLSHYFQNNGVNCNYIDLIGYLADISSWEALNSPLESRWPSSEDDFTVVIYSKEDKLNEYLTRKGMINHFPHETVLQGDGWAVTRYKQTTADISGEHERFIFSIVVTDDEKREEAIKAFIENAYQLVGLPTEEENGIPGFEAVFAVLGLLAVAYVQRRKK